MPDSDAQEIFFIIFLFPPQPLLVLISCRVLSNVLATDQNGFLPMKKCLIFLALFPFYCSLILAQTSFIVVSGTVQTEGPAPATNYPVLIYNPIENTAATVFTNPNGYYIDTLEITETQGYVEIYVTNCNGIKLQETRDYSVPDFIDLTANFEVCKASVNCQAAFEFENIGGNSISFLNFSNPINTNTSYQWYFGDGNSSRDPDPFHTYPGPGTYQVCLSIENDEDSCFSTMCYPIFVENDSSTSNCNPLFHVAQQDGYNVVFEADFPSDGLNYSWSFGYPGATATTSLAEHTFPSPGTYTVCLVVWDEQTNCEKSYCKEIEILADQCTAAFTSGFQDDGSFVANAIGGGVGLGYFWDVTDLASNLVPFERINGGAGIKVVFPYEGAFNVCLTLDATGQGNDGCSDRVCEQVIVQDTLPCVTDFTVELGNNGSAVFASNDPHPLKTYQWKVNGNLLDQQGSSIEHVFDQPGNYEVCLIVSSETGCFETECKEVVVGNTAICTAEFEILPAPNVNNVYVFQAAADSPDLIYQWTVDGTLLPDSLSFVEYEFNPGEHEVCLVVYSLNGPCQQSSCQRIVVQEQPCEINANYEYEPVAGIPFKYNFYAVDGQNDLNYSWDFGDGIAVANQGVVSHIFPGPGEYEVCLFVWKANADSCEQRVCKTIAVFDSVTCDPSFTYDPAGDYKVYFIANEDRPGYTYQWNFQDGSPQVLTDTARETNHIFPGPGTYQVCLTITSPDGSCTERKCKDIVLGDPIDCNAEFVAIATSDSSYVFEAVSQDTRLIFQWIVDGTFVTDSTGRFEYSFGPGTHEICLEVYAPGSTCQKRFCKTIVVGGSNDCLADFQYAQTTNGEYTFVSSSIGDNLLHQWWINNEILPDTSDQISYAFDAPGQYEVCLIILSNACTDTICKTISIGGEPCDINASFDYVQLNEPFKYQFTAHDTTPGLNYSWVFENGISLGNQASVNHVFPGPGTYQVCLLVFTNVDSCEKRYCKEIVVGDPIECNADFEYDLTASGEYVFEAIVRNENLRYQWSVNNEILNDTSSRILYAFDGPGEYEVCLLIYDERGECEVRSCKIVTISPPVCDASFVFDPVGDEYKVYFRANHAAVGTLYNWNFGDNSNPVADTAQEIYHTFPGPGRYEVCLTILGGNCIDSKCLEVIVPGQVDCTAEFETTIIGGEDYYFEAIVQDSNLTYNWSVNGELVNLPSYPLFEIDFNEPGVYEICLEVIDSITGCSDKFCETVIDGDTTQCSAKFEYTVIGGEDYYFESIVQDSSLNYKWSINGEVYDVFNNSFLLEIDFDEPGTYEVCLEVFDGNGACRDIYCETIIDGDTTICNADFAYDLTAVGVYVFEAFAQSPDLKYQWFINGDLVADGAGLDRLEYQFDGFGEYEVCLVVFSADGSCQKRSCQIILIDNPGICDATFAYDVFENTARFYPLTTPTTTPVLRYFWTFGDGGQSNDVFPSHTYNQPGAYLVCLEVFGADSTCYDNYCDTVYVGNNVFCDAGFVEEPLDSTNQAFEFYAFSAQDSAADYQYKWDFGDGNTSNDQQPKHRYDAPGIYVVCLYVYNPATECEDRFCKELFVGQTTDCYADFDFEVDQQTGTAIFFINPDQVPDHYNVFWSLGDGTEVQGDFVVDHQYNAPGTYEVCLVIESPDGCRDIKCKEVIIRGESECTADFEFEQKGEKEVQFFPYIPPTDLALVYEWDFGDGNTSMEERPIHTYRQAGEYKVCLIVSTPDGSCRDEICKRVKIQPTATCDASFGYTENLGLTIGFAANEIREDLKYLWFFGDGIGLEEGPILRHTFPAAGEYLVCLTVTDGFSCFETSCQTIEVFDVGGECRANFSFLRAQNNTYIFSDQSTGGVAPLTYSWDFGDGNTSDQANPVHSYRDDKNYEVCLTVTDATGCEATFCQNIGGYLIEGEVFIDNRLVDYGVAYLIYHDPITQELITVDTSLVQEGKYAFMNVGPGTFLVKVALLPDSPVYQDYLPTYLGDRLFWHEAISVVIATSDVFLPPINMIPGNNAGGPGLIGGSIISNADAAIGPVPSVSVLLLDENGNPVTHVDTDENGNYDFNSLPYGTYQVVVEIPGKVAQVFWITIGPEKATVPDADFEVGPTEVTTDIPNELEALNWNAYPSPAIDEIKIDMDLKTAGEVQFSILNLIGQEMQTHSKFFGKGTQTMKMVIRELPEGVFILKVNTRDGQFVKRMIKQ